MSSATLLNSALSPVTARLARGARAARAIGNRSFATFMVFAKRRRAVVRATRASLHLGAREDDDLRPLRRLGGDDLGEILRRALDRLAPQLRLARQPIGITERPVRFGIGLLDDLRGRSPGPSDAEPRGGLVAGHV